MSTFSPCQLSPHLNFLPISPCQLSPHVNFLPMSNSPCLKFPYIPNHVVDPRRNFIIFQTPKVLKNHIKRLKPQRRLEIQDESQGIKRHIKIRRKTTEKSSPALWLPVEQIHAVSARRLVPRITSQTPNDYL